MRGVGALFRSGDERERVGRPLTARDGVNGCYQQRPERTCSEAWGRARHSEEEKGLGGREGTRRARGFGERETQRTGVSPALCLPGVTLSRRSLVVTSESLWQGAATAAADQDSGPGGRGRPGGAGPRPAPASSESVISLAAGTFPLAGAGWRLRDVPPSEARCG